MDMGSGYYWEKNARTYVYCISKRSLDSMQRYQITNLRSQHQDSETELCIHQGGVNTNETTVTADQLGLVASWEGLLALVDLAKWPCKAYS
jgi:hypothetical protein